MQQGVQPRKGVRVEVSNRAWVRKADLTPQQIEKLRTELTITPTNSFNPADVKPLQLYVETAKAFGLPREYFLRRRKPHHDVTWKTTTNAGAWPSKLAFTAKLREDQEVAVKAVLDALRTPFDTQRPEAGNACLGGILEAPTGFGKTVCSCAIIAALQVPTLVIVNKEPLVGQWREELERFLPGVQIGLIQGPTADYRGKHVVIAMLQSLSEKTYPQALYQWPGLVLFDEAHRAAAASWCKVTPKFLSQWRIGVTATPERTDNAEDAFFWHLGHILYQATTLQLKPLIKVIETPFISMTDKGPDLEREMCNSLARNRVIVTQLVKAVRAGRIPFVLSKRKAHLVILEKMFVDAWLCTHAAESSDPAIYQMGATLMTLGHLTNPIRLLGKKLVHAQGEPDADDEFAELASVTDPSPERAALVAALPAVPRVVQCVGGISDANMDIVKTTAEVVFATSQFVSEGFNVPRLDTLFLVLPMVAVKQAVGRILRDVPNKKPPIVVDFQDGNQRARAYARKRAKQYSAIIDNCQALR